jgi:flagellar protein FliS
MFTSAIARTASAYKRVGLETSVDSADPHHLVCLLFDALKTTLYASRVAMESGDISTKVTKISSAMRILDEGLKAPLNLEEGGQIAQNLDALYDYCINRLALANARNDVKIIDEIMALIEPVASGWKQISGQGPAYLKPV